MQLAKARRNAVKYAEQADIYGPASPYGNVADNMHIALASMWAAVANCLKVGAADGPDSIDGLPDANGVITR